MTTLIFENEYLKDKDSEIRSNSMNWYTNTIKILQLVHTDIPWTLLSNKKNKNGWLMSRQTFLKGHKNQKNYRNKSKKNAIKKINLFKLSYTMCVQSKNVGKLCGGLCKLSRRYLHKKWEGKAKLEASTATVFSFG